MTYSEELSEKIQICRELFLKHGGEKHELIEQEMRYLGYHDFHRRILYRRYERGTSTPGWIETYGWRGLLPKVKPAKPELVADTYPEVSDPPEPVIQPTYPRPIPAYQMPDFDEFKDWLKRTWPGKEWEWKHLVYIYKRLKRVWDGDCKRLMIFMPPRHGKSELVTVRYPAWELKHNPETKIIIGCYNQPLANRFSRMIRSSLAEDAFLSVPPAVAGGSTTEPTQVRKQFPTEPPTRCEFSPRSQLQPPATAGGTDWFVHTRAKNSETEWETVQGGGVRAVGVGAGITGYGAHLIIIDDPVKSRAEAESETCRQRVWNWFNDDVYTRLEPDGKIILIQTRWHEDDLAGRLLREAKEGGEQWEVISLAALAESEIENGKLRMENATLLSPTGTNIIAQGKAPGRNPGYSAQHDPDPEGVERSAGDVAPLQGADVLESCPGVTLAPLVHPRLLSLSPSATRELRTFDPLGRAPGEALCPERYSREKLERIKRKIGSYSFAALYQQRPAPAEGGQFKRAWFRKIIDAAPEGLTWKRGYDLAVSTKQTADYTASFRCAKDQQGNLYIADGFRARIEYPDQRRYILGRMRDEPSTEHGIEAALHGQAFVQDLRREVGPGRFAFRAVRVAADKLTRALAWLNLAEEGKLYLVRGPWIDAFVDEVARFPTGRHDDQIDAVSLAVNMLETRRYRSMGF